MSHFDKVRIFANLAYLFVEDEQDETSETMRIVYTDDENGHFVGVDESGQEYQVNYIDVDLDKSKFYALSELK